MTRRWITVPMLALGLAAAPAIFAQSQESNANAAGPGTINYVQGAVSIDGQPITRKQIGSATLEQGDELTTGNGRAEILLTPGVFLRVDRNSAVKMVSPMLDLTQVELDKGKAGVEVDEIHDENNLQVIDADVTTRLQKTGYYEFDANHPEVMVFKGSADVQIPDTSGKEVKGNHQFMLAGAANGQPVAREKQQNLKDNRADDSLFNWSKLRARYLTEADQQMAEENGGDMNPGWDWDPFMMGYAYMGGPFFSPFGWGFGPFGWGGGMGWGGGWYGGGWDRDDSYGRGFAGRGRVGGFARGGGFHGGQGFHGGGFHGGGGGFHGGGGAHR